MTNTDLTYGFNLSLLVSNINPVWKSKVQMVEWKVSLFTSVLLAATWFSSPGAISFTNGSLLKAENRERKKWSEVRKEGKIENESMRFDRYYFLEPLIWSVSMVAFVASNKVGTHFKQCFFVRWTKCQKVRTTMGGKMPTIVIQSLLAKIH